MKKIVIIGANSFQNPLILKAKEMGYERIITYILISESGASLKAAGWECEKEIAGGGSWDTPARRRHTTAPQCKKQRWMKNLCKEGDESRESEL